MNRKHKHVLTFICLASMFLPCLFTFSQFSTPTDSENSDLLKYEMNDVFIGNLKHTIQINNTASRRVVGGNLFVPIIRNETARHYVILHNISSLTRQPTLLNDGSGNKYACWNNMIIDGEQTFTVEINYYVFSFSTHYLIDSSLIADYKKSSDLYMKYTQPEKLIQSNDSKIISKALDVTRGEDNTHEKVSKIYNFVITHLRYSFQDEERGALWALENGVGDCSEYSYLFVALCRAAGIPAKIQAGFAFHAFSETLEDGHMWAEYYLENYGWIPMDATWRLFDAMDCRHFSSIQSVPEVTPYANYVFNYTIGPEWVEEKQVISVKLCSADVFGDPFAEKTVNTVTKIKQAKFVILLAKVFGAPLIFPSELGESKQVLLRSEIYLQNAIDSWRKRPQLAPSNIAIALSDAENVLRNAWMLTAKTFTLFISISIVILLILTVFLKRYHAEQKKMILRKS